MSFVEAARNIMLFAPVVLFLIALIWMFRRQQRRNGVETRPLQWNVIRIDETLGRPREGSLTVQGHELIYTTVRCRQPVWIHDVDDVCVSRVRAGLEVTVLVPSDGPYTFAIGDPTQERTAFSQREANEFVHRLRELGARSA